MAKEYYRKESKENNLMKKKSNEFLPLNLSHVTSKEDIQVKNNNIIIDLTN
jgi:hypothetical protein